jgi:RNA polymerase sigma-70 factor (ECF subfamily)
MDSLRLPATWGGDTESLLERGRSWVFLRAREPAATAERPAPRGDNRALDDAMDRYAGGADASFSEVYDALAPRLYGYLVRQIRNPGVAEELVQQTFMHMHRARGQFVRGAPVLPWAFAIARRLLVDHVRRHKREVIATMSEDGIEDTAPSEDAAADDLLHASQMADRVRDVLRTLPASQRVAFELLKIEELSVAEAAQVVGTTSAAIKLRAHRAYEAIREALGDISPASQKNSPLDTDDTSRATRRRPGDDT